MLRWTLTAILATYLVGCQAPSGRDGLPTVFVRYVKLEEGSPRRAMIAFDWTDITDAVSPLQLEVHSAIDDKGRTLEVNPYDGLISHSFGTMGSWVSTISRPPHSFDISVPDGTSKIALLRGSVHFKAVESMRDIVVDDPTEGRRFQAGEFSAEIAEARPWGYDIRFHRGGPGDTALEVQARMSAAAVILRDGTVTRTREARIWGGGLLKWEYEGRTLREEERGGAGLRIQFALELKEGTVAALRLSFADRVVSRQIDFELRDIPLR